MIVTFGVIVLAGLVGKYIHSRLSNSNIPRIEIARINKAIARAEDVNSGKVKEILPADANS